MRGQDQGGGGYAFFRIANGKFVETVEEKTAGSIRVEYTPKGTTEVKVRYEVRNPWLQGRLMPFGEKVKQWEGTDVTYLVVKMVDSRGEKYWIEIHQQSRYWSHLMTRLPNIDVTEEIRLCPYDFADKKTGKQVIGMNVFQGPDMALKIPPKWTKDNPGDGADRLPQAVPHVINGSKVWDFTEQMQFLNAMRIQRNIDIEHALGTNPVVGVAANQEHPVARATDDPAAEGVRMTGPGQLPGHQAIDEDDLPF